MAMTFEIRPIPFEHDLLACLADDILASDELGRTLVLLPSSRACRTLGHILLERSGREALLLPRVLTPGQLEQELGLALGLADDGLPGDRTRPLILAHRLRDEPWLKDRSESAPGLAQEFLEIFDLIRAYGLQDRLLGPDADREWTAVVGARAAEQQEAELSRIRRVWSLYRQVVGRDAVDWRRELAAQVGAPESRGMVRTVAHADHVLVAGFANLDPLRAAVFKAVGAAVNGAVLYTPETGDRLSLFFTSTWSATGSGDLDPLAPGRRIQELLGLAGEPDAEPEPEAPLDLRARVAALGPREDFWQPHGPLEVLACGTAEDESLVVADLVVRILSRPEGANRRTAVVTNDPALAARVVAQLRGAGIDTDQTLGAPLGSLPAGLLLRHLLRAALTDFRPDCLLEVVTHPFVEVPGVAGRGEMWALRLERMLRRHQGAQPGAAGLQQLAAARDEASRHLQGDGTDEKNADMADYIASLLDSFAPLTELQGSIFVDWSTAIAAIGRTWDALCPERPLQEDPERSDLTALARLLEDLARDAHLLPPTSLSEVTGDLARMLSAESVAPHRGQARPVLVTGTVEARLERFDHLILCGMADGSFPARRSRPLFLGTALRRHLGLPDWRAANARDAELFLRLLFNAPQVTITHPTEGEGRGILPSPFVQRLCLALPEGREPRRAQAPASWRRRPAPGFDPAPSQVVFAAEGLAPRATEPIRPLRRLSWSALARWRECPYRHLLERGFVLHKEEEVREEFGRRDHGSLVHRALENFLDPQQKGQAALLAGRAGEAVSLLSDLAREVFLPPGEDSPLRRLWLGKFLRCVPAIVDVELERCGLWRPIRREHGFEISLARLREGLVTISAAEEAASLVPAAEEGDETIILRGSIDRVDQHVDSLGEPQKVVAVLDYKTGKPPAAKSLKDLEDLQIVLYALVLEADEPDMRVREGAYYAVDEDQAGPPAKPHLPAGGRDLLVRGGVELVRMARAAADESAAFDLLPRQRAGLGPSLLPCRWCDLRGVCRLEEKSGLPAPVVARLDGLINKKEGQF